MSLSTCKSYKLIVEKSTVPVNTGEALKRTVAKYLRSDIPFDVASNPEFLREGTAVEDAFKPDRIVVGLESTRAENLLREIYKPHHRKNQLPLSGHQHCECRINQTREQLLSGYEDFLY